MTEIDLDKIAEEVRKGILKSSSLNVYLEIIKSALLKVANATREETIRECADICVELVDRDYIRSLLKPKEDADVK